MRILIAGGGQVGTLIARRLIRESNEVTIIDRNDERCAQLEEKLDAKVVRGNAIGMGTLHDAGLQDAEMLIAVTGSDEINFLACLIAQLESKVGVKVARIRSHEVEHWRRMASTAGLQIDLIIHPETDVAERIMRVVHIPGVSDILDFAGGDVKVFGMNVEPDSWFADKTLAELEAASPPKNSLIAMIFRAQQVIIPHGNERLCPGDHIYVVGTRHNLDEVFAFMGLKK